MCCVGTYCVGDAGPLLTTAAAASLARDAFLYGGITYVRNGGEYVRGDAAGGDAAAGDAAAKSPDAGAGAPPSL